MIIGCAFNNDEFDVVGTEPFRRTQGIFPVLTKLTSFKVTGIRLINSGYDHVLVGVTSPCDVVTRGNLGLSDCSDTLYHGHLPFHATEEAVYTLDLCRPFLFRACNGYAWRG